MVDNYFYLKYEEDIFSFVQNEFINGYNEAYKFYVFHGHLNVPLEYIINAYPLGQFVALISQIKEFLTPNQMVMMEVLDISWYKEYLEEEERPLDKVWKEKYALAQKFYERHQHLKVPADYHIGTTGLGSWIATQRKAEKEGRLSRRKTELLDAIKMIYSFDYLEEIVRISSLPQNALAIPEKYLVISPFEQTLNPFIEKPLKGYSNAQLPFFRTTKIIPKTTSVNIQQMQLEISKEFIIMDIKNLLKGLPLEILDSFPIDNLRDKTLPELFGLKQRLSILTYKKSEKTYKIS